MGFRESPYGNYNFQVNLGGEEPTDVIAGFMEVVLPEARIDVIEYRQGNYKDLSTMKLPGRVHYGNLVLKRGAMGSGQSLRMVGPGAERNCRCAAECVHHLAAGGPPDCGDDLAV